MVELLTVVAITLGLVLIARAIDELSKTTRRAAMLQEETACEMMELLDEQALQSAGATLVQAQVMVRLSENVAQLTDAIRFPPRSLRHGPNC